MMRLSPWLMTCLALAALTVGAACGGGETKPQPKPKAEAPPGFPDGYATWHKANAETILRDEEGLAREIYADAKPDLAKDTVLVKEQYALAEGAVGELQQIAVMRRGADEANAGWSFTVYDPKTKKELEDGASACVGCHTLQIDNDYLFTARDALMPPAESEGEGGPDEGAGEAGSTDEDGGAGEEGGAADEGDAPAEEGGE